MRDAHRAETVGVDRAAPRKRARRALAAAAVDVALIAVAHAIGAGGGAARARERGEQQDEGGDQQPAHISTPLQLVKPAAHGPSGIDAG